MCNINGDQPTSPSLPGHVHERYDLRRVVHSSAMYHYSASDSLYWSDRWEFRSYKLTKIPHSCNEWNGCHWWDPLNWTLPTVDCIHSTCTPGPSGMRPMSPCRTTYTLANHPDPPDTAQHIWRYKCAMFPSQPVGWRQAPYQALLFCQEFPVQFQNSARVHAR